jgi:3-oxoacid CoA-transferase subunit A/glutaconate CoA-transferase subunit A
MLGTDTEEYSSCKVITDPFSGKPVNLIPASYPDVAFIHVHRCDKYGNCQIDGILVEDFELARCARRLIITTEEVVNEDVIRREPWRTCIPFYVVDAIVEQPFGSHPCEMHGKYASDEQHIAEWLKLSVTDEGVSEYVAKYIDSVKTFDQYLELCGGMNRLFCLMKKEALDVPLGGD